MLKKKKTQAFSAPKDKGTKQLIRRNASSPLFQLPKEIRDQIWGYVLGNETIHIKYKRVINDSEGSLRYLVCSATHSEQAAYEKSKSVEYDKLQPSSPTLESSGDTRDIRLSRDRHHSCYAQYNDDTREYIGKPEKLPIHALQVCRQMYVDLNNSLWLTTIWSFTHASALHHFLDNRNATQRRLMKKVHLDISPIYTWPGHPWLEGWNVALHKKNLSKFKSVEAVHMDFCGNRISVGLGNGDMYPNPYMFEFANIRFFPGLKHVTVICIGMHKSDSVPPFELMNHSQMLEMAEDIRLRALGRERDPYVLSEDDEL